MPDLKKIFERTTIAFSLTAIFGLALLFANPSGIVSQWIADRMTPEPPYHFSEDPGEGYRILFADP